MAGMIFWLIGGGIGCVALGVYIGYTFCARVNGGIFQEMYDSGVMLLKMEDGNWEGQPSALAELKQGTTSCQQQTNVANIMVPK
jgi:hypothetical protein